MAKDIHQNKSAGIQREILETLLILVSIMTVLISIISITVSISTDRKRLDQNLENVAQALAQSEIIRQSDSDENSENMIVPYLDSLKSSLTNIDVISIISDRNIRIYHTNHELIGTEYDGTIPDFSSGDIFYVTSDIGPSGSQRRAYAAIYDNDGNYLGFVLAVMLSQNIRKIVVSNILLHTLCAVTVIAVAVALSKQLSSRIKRILKGYEPDIFSAMFTVRDNVLEALEEGLLAFDNEGSIVYMNCSAKKMLDLKDNVKNAAEAIPEFSANKVFSSCEKISGLSLHSDNGSDILADIIPITDNENTEGGLCILRDRTEFTKLMEDLSGVKYLVESMRANNHDFTNKLHVILGLIQMNRTSEACEYIANITSIQQKVIHNVMKNIEEPSVAALLIGKYSRAAELDITFSLESGSKLSKNDISLPSGDLITIIGNLIENAMDSLNEKNELPKELSVGIYTKPHAMIITVDDTGNGISDENTERIFQYGFSTKGDGRGTGLALVRQLVAKHNGTITVDSEPGTGTSFTVTLTDEGEAQMYEVMIVEDDPMVAMINKQYVTENKHFHVSCVCRDGDRALEMLRENTVHLVILDVYMPKTNGLELLRKIREINLPVSVIMVTAANDSAAIEEAMRLGVVDYLVKPFSSVRFQRALETFLNRQEAFHDLSSFSQQHIDAIMNRSSSETSEQLPKGIQDQTLETIKSFLEHSPDTDLTSEEIADKVGLSRVTVRRYVNFLLEKGVIVGNMNYETGGRPCMLYRLNKSE